SRESAFLLNNVLLIAAAFTVFFGTVFPLLSEAVRGVKVSVGAPFFNQVNVPLFLSLIFLMGVGPLIAWRRASLENLKRNFLWPVLIGAVAALILRLLGVRSTVAVVALALTIFVTATIAVDLLRATRARRLMGERALPALGGLLLRHNRRYGGFIVHLAVLGGLARDGSHATVKMQVNRMVSWIWIGGLILTLGTLLAVLPERRKTA